MTPSPTALRGVVPPVCTPLTPDLEVDARSLERLIAHLLDAGVDGLFVLGSTSEVAFLPDAHRARVLEIAVGTVAGRVPVVAGVIDTATLRVADHVRTAEKLGADGVVATAPFYTRTHPAEVDAHFRMLRAVTDLPVIAYDLPVSVHSKLGTAQLATLARDGVIQAVKDSSGDEGGFRRLLLETADVPGFALLTGSELTVDTSFRMGAHGVVPGLGNVDPSGYTRLRDLAAAGDWDAAKAEQERLIALFGLVDAGAPERMGRGSSALGAFKAALHALGVIDCPVTATPQIPLNAAEVDVVRGHLVRAGLLAA
ncbi:dihydrodipicolinate synthase family protein [Streptomyces sp. SID3343]|uniref:dihydrodipicolinate synthase family protein n=1 Tax=Streptomyces sp. SID3343 TaxID=2690260 RepID=UPI00136C4604|nr:dihydrodipicolinate synthase family protein [Streptomyces sp. SID3343]MYW03588.1 dihydrodipicolinate synthase family protein [Streptomyces sp. SID3343]